MTRSDIESILNEVVNPGLAAEGGAITFLEATTIAESPTIVLKLSGVKDITFEATEGIRRGVQLLLQQKLSLPTLKIKMIGERY